MDDRWDPVSLDSRRAVKVFLHPTASIPQVRNGIDPGSPPDVVDLTSFMSQGSYSQFDANITLNFNRELFDIGQPRPNQILEIQLWQQTIGFQTAWIGVVDSISAFTMSRGERSLQLLAKSRDSQNIWRVTKRSTELFPQLTDFSYIGRKVARNVGLTQEEILLPSSSFLTAHINTQMADMSAWEMLQTLFLPLGWTPFINCLGQLKVHNRELQGRQPDFILTDAQVIRVGANRQRPPTSRVRVVWLDPILKKSLQQSRKLTDHTVTMGWFRLWHHKTVYFSDDHTQRAQNTYWDIEQTVNVLIPNFCTESYAQQTQNYGRITLHNWGGVGAMAALITTWVIWANTPRHVTVAGVGASEGFAWPHYAEIAAQMAFMILCMNIGTGVYGIWGTPYDWVHARNITEAFDISTPRWVDDPVAIESDFIINEGHAQAMAVRELIFQARSANKWTVSIVDDFRVEYGDVIQFPDGSKMFVEDWKRSITKGSEPVLELQGFLLGGSSSTVGGVVKPLLPEPAVNPALPAGPAPPVPPANPCPDVYEINTPCTWDDAEIARRVNLALNASPHSTDDRAYWNNKLNTESVGADWDYWVYNKMQVSRSIPLSTFN